MEKFLKKLCPVFLVLSLALSLTGCADSLSASVMSDATKDTTKSGAKLYSLEAQGKVERVYVTSGRYGFYTLLLSIDDKDITGFTTLTVPYEYYLGAEKGNTVRFSGKFWHYDDGSLSSLFSTTMLDTTIIPIKEGIKYK